MRLLRILTLLVSGVMITGCASSTSTGLTATPRVEPPLACRIECDMPPSTLLPREQWDGAVFRWGAACAELHRDCVVENTRIVNSDRISQ